MTDTPDEPPFQKPSHVFVTQEGAWLNREAASKYGEISYIVPRDVGMLETDRIRNSVLSFYLSHKIDFYKDYILITGSPVIAIEVLNTFQSSGCYPVNYLAWDSLVHDYTIRKLEAI